MKKINIVILLIIVISCGGNPDNNKNKFEYKMVLNAFSINCLLDFPVYQDLFSLQ